MLTLTVDLPKLDQLEQETVSGILLAGKQTLTEAARLLELELEALTKAAVPGRAYRAWNSQVFPRGGQLSYTPMAEVYAKGGRRTRGMIQYWTQPGVNRAKDGYWLAIPTAAAGGRGIGRDLTPGEWERATGIKLQFVWLKGRQNRAALVAEGVFNRQGGGALRSASDRRMAKDRREGFARKKVTVPIFILVREQRHANAIATEPAQRRAEQYLAREFVERAHRLVVGK